MNFRQPRTFPMVPYSMPCGAAALTPQPSSARRPSLRRIRYRSGDMWPTLGSRTHRRGGDDGERHAAACQIRHFFLQALHARSRLPCMVGRSAGDAPEEHVKAVSKKLMELNPGFDGKVQSHIQDGFVRNLQFITKNVADISPVRALRT